MRFGAAGKVMYGQLRPGLDGQCEDWYGRNGTERYGWVWHCGVWLGAAGLVKVWQAWRVKARYGKVWSGLAG